MSCKMLGRIIPALAALVLVPSPGVKSRICYLCLPMCKLGVGLATVFQTVFVTRKRILNLLTCSVQVTSRACCTARCSKWQRCSNCSPIHCPWPLLNFYFFFYVFGANGIHKAAC